MNSSSNINLKNQQDNTELEIGSFNEDEEQFMNKKQLVHIDDDTSINIDVSDDDRSKSSTLKKSYLINNMSAFNEQFPINNQLIKKNEKENNLNDITNSADFYNNENGLGNFPLIFSEKSRELLINKNKINNIENSDFYDNNNMNNDMIKYLDTKIDNNGFFFSKKNEKLNDDNNINYITNKKINLKNNDINLSIKDIDEEEEDNNDNNNKIISTQMMFQNKNSKYNIINNIKNQKNVSKNEELLITNNKITNNNKNSNYNKNNILQKGNFSLYILGINNNNKISGSINSNEQTFGLLQSKEFYNKYNQLEANYNDILNKYKNLEKEYEELKNSNKSVLDLLAYWQKFYLEILEIVKINCNKNDDSTNNYMDDPYRLQVINEVKKIIVISRDKAFNYFYKTKNIQFNIKSEKKKDINNNINNKIIDLNKKIIICQNEALFYKGKEIEKDNNFKKNIDKEEELNSLPPIRHIQKINSGTNTIEEKPIIKEVIKEIIVQKKKFDEKNLVISSKKFDILKKKEIKKENIRKYNELEIFSSIKLNFKKSNKIMKKFKKNIMQKIAEVQTDMTYKNINSIETLNKACSSQLLNSQREKEKMQKFYEEKINSLNNIINENYKSMKKENEKNKKNEVIKEKNNCNIEENKIITNKEEENLNNSFIFLPEMIPPENTYKIFIHCIKHFKYEEDIYKKYLEEEDLFTLKNFVQKMEKYLIETSLPILKYNKKNKKEKNKENKAINPENKNIKKYKENNNNNHERNKYSNSLHSKDNKMIGGEKINSIYNNNNTFNKYKAAILALKEN